METSWDSLQWLMYQIHKMRQQMTEERNLPEPNYTIIKRIEQRCRKYEVQFRDMTNELIPEHLPCDRATLNHEGRTSRSITRSTETVQ